MLTVFYFILKRTELSTHATKVTRSLELKKWFARRQDRYLPFILLDMSMLLMMMTMFINHYDGDKDD